MSAATESRNTIPLAGLGSLPKKLTVKDAVILLAGVMLAIDATPEAVEASDTAGLQLVGLCPEYIDNTDDGELVNPEMGCFKWANDENNTVAAGDRIAYVKDNQTVCASTGSTNKVVAGLVIAVESDGVWMCQTLEGLRAAQALHAAGVASASNHIADPASAAAITALAPAALTYADPAAITAQAPAACAAMTATLVGVDTGTDMTAAQAATLVADLAALKAGIDANNAAIDQLIADVTAIRTKLLAAGVDLGVVRTPVVALVTDVTAVRTGSEANNAAIDSVLAALEAQEIVKTA